MTPDEENCVGLNILKGLRVNEASIHVDVLKIKLAEKWAFNITY